MAGALRDGCRGDRLPTRVLFERHQPSLAAFAEVPARVPAGAAPSRLSRSTAAAASVKAPLSNPTYRRPRAVEAQCLADLNDPITRAEQQLAYAYMRADALPYLGPRAALAQMEDEGVAAR